MSPVFSERAGGGGGGEGGGGGGGGEGGGRGGGGGGRGGGRGGFLGKLAYIIIVTDVPCKAAICTQISK